MIYPSRSEERIFKSQFLPVLCAILIYGCALPDPSWRVETALDIIYDQEEPIVRRTERNVRVYEYSQVSPPVRPLVIETDVKSSFRWGEPGHEGHVTIKARRYHGKIPEENPLYVIDTKGVAATFNRDFIVVTYDDWFAQDIYHYYFVGTGVFAFESLGLPVKFGFPDKPAYAPSRPDYRDWGVRFGAFSPLSPRIPKFLTEKKRTIGLLVYTDATHVLAEALLLADDIETAHRLAAIADQHPVLAWINRETGEQQDPYIAPRHENLSDVALRIRFAEARLDLFFPVKPSDFDYARLRLPKGLSLVPLDKPH